MKKIFAICLFIVAFPSIAFSLEPVAATKIVVGGGSVSGLSPRDGVIVSRSMLGSTDAHGFTDATVIDDVRDPGTYGSFDSVVDLRGKKDHNHVYSFQDRFKLSGSQSLEFAGGFISRPKLSGPGKILMRTAVDVGVVDVSGKGSVGQNIGLFVRDLSSGEMNVALVMSQSKGYGIYSSGSAPSYHKSDILFGSGNGPILLDDPRASESPRDLSASERLVAKRIKGLIKSYRNKVSGKTHFGISANDIQVAFSEGGLDVNDYAILEKTQQGLGIRYDDLMAFIISAL